MKPIHAEILSFESRGKDLKTLSTDEIRSGPGHKVRKYSELISKLARLAFANPELVLLMRGQSADYQEKSKSTLFPTMYRASTGNSFYGAELRRRYEGLRRCEESLYHVLQAYPSYWDRVGRNELARWAILQHYEVCPTPLLDVTHSPLVACSFSFLGPRAGQGGHFYLYVLGVPQINGAITVSPAHALQVVRLSSVCPPDTLRPYFQEGYLIGTYPSVDTLDEKMRYDRSEMDGAQRLVAKFRIPASPDFWDQGFRGLPKAALYPDERGELCSKLGNLKREALAYA